MADNGMGNTFKEAVEETPDIAKGYAGGLRALGGNAQVVSAKDTRLIDGSVDIDGCTSTLYPNASRWDYAIGYDGKAYFLEVHPADTSNVKEVIKKAEWLKNWLENKAPRLKQIAADKAFYWVASGRCCILRGSVQSKRLAQSNVLLVNKLNLPV